jgi:hypothetical protein
MRFDRESWRKLYVAESAEHALMPLVVRGLRDYLLRFAAEDGTLLPNTSDPVPDLAFLLRARPAEHEFVELAISELQRVGYLKLTRGRLWLPKFEDAQAARSPGAKRQAAYKAREEAKRAAAGTSPKTSAETSPQASPSDVTADTGGDVTNEETRRDETTTTAAPVVVDPDLPVSCPADLRLLDPQIQTLKTGLMVPDRAISALTTKFIGSYQGNPNDLRPIHAWRKCLSQAIGGWWNDPRVKSQFLAAQRAAGDGNDGYGKPAEWVV